MNYSLLVMETAGMMKMATGDGFPLWQGAGVGVKTSRSRVGGPKLCVMDRWVTGDRGHDVYPGSGPLNGGNTLLPA